MKGQKKSQIDGQLSRREFLMSTAGLGAGAALASAGLTSALTGALPIDVMAGPRLDYYQPAIDLAIAKGGTPARNCLAAVEALGGFSKFVHPGDKVVVKPNPIGAIRPRMRSIPIPRPPVGGIPYSKAWRKSSSAISTSVFTSSPNSIAAFARSVSSIVMTPPSPGFSFS